LVLKHLSIVVNTSQYDNQYLEDRFGNIPVNSLSPALIDQEVRLVQTNTTEETKMVTTNDLEVDGSDALFPATELKTYDGVLHSLPIEILDLKPGESIQLSCRIQKALTGDNGRYVVAPVCHFKGIMDEAAAAKAYEDLPEEVKTDEYRKNWQNLYSHQFTVPDQFTFVLETLPNCGYTNASALAAACDIIVDSITASKMWKVKVEDDDSTHMEIVMDEFVGYLFEHALYGKAGVQFVKYGKRHPHDPMGTLRVKTTTVEIDVTKLIQEAVESMRRFYVSIASGVGGKRLHPKLQKAFDSFKRASAPEKRERLLELGVDRSRVEGAAEEDLDTMAEVWLHQTERKAVPTLDMDVAEEIKKEKDEDLQKEEKEMLKEEEPVEAAA